MALHIGSVHDNEAVLEVVLPVYGPVATFIIAFYVLGAASSDVLLRVLKK